MAELLAKDEAHRLVESLPEKATWEDLQQAIYVRQVIAAGLADVEAGRVTPTSELRKRYGLPE